MKYNSSQNDEGRRSRGGSHRGQRNHRSSGGNSRGGRSDFYPVSREDKPAAKPTFWQKLLSFFGGKKAAPTPASSRGKYPSDQPERSRSTEPATQRTPAREPRTMRPPERVEVTSPKLYVGNLSYEAAESDLFELFKGVGKVRSAEVVSNPHTQRSKGFAFVQMETTDEARRAVVELHDQEFFGRKLVVSGAKTSDAPADRAERSAA